MVQDEATGYWLITMATQEPWAEVELRINDDHEETKVVFDTFVTGAM